MKIHENFHVKSLFHHDKSNRMNLYTTLHINFASNLHIFTRYVFRFVELCSTRNQCFCFQVILCFCLFLIQNI